MWNYEIVMKSKKFDAVQKYLRKKNRNKHVICMCEVHSFFIKVIAQIQNLNSLNSKIFHNKRMPECSMTASN